MPVITLLNQKGGAGSRHHASPGRHCSPRRAVASCCSTTTPRPASLKGFWGPSRDGRPRPGGDDRGHLRWPRSLPRAGHQADRHRWHRPGPRPKQATDFNVPRPFETPAEMQACLGSFPGRRPRPLRSGADRKRPEPSPVLLGGPGRQRPPHRPTPGRGLWGAQGPGPVQESVDLVATGPNPRLNLLGFLLTMHNARLAIHNALRDLPPRAIRARRVFETPRTLRGRLQGSHRPAQADRPVQAQGCVGQGDQGAGRRATRPAGRCTVHCRLTQEAA